MANDYVWRVQLGKLKGPGMPPDSTNTNSVLPCCVSYHLFQLLMDVVALHTSKRTFLLTSKGVFKCKQVAAD